MEKEIDLEKLVKWIDDSDLHTFVAFDGNKPVESINRDLDSIKEALNIHDKIFLQIGFYGYDDEFGKESAFMFDANEGIDDLEDDYYDKYKFFVAGYGIYLDNDLNVEYGYFTIEAPPSGHGAGNTTFHDFKDVLVRDIIKKKIYSLINSSKIWKTDDPPVINWRDDKEIILEKLIGLVTDISNLVDDTCFNFKQKEDIINELVEELYYFRKDIIKSKMKLEIVGECPNCGNKISKWTKNTVIIKCSECENTFLFD